MRAVRGARSRVHATDSQKESAGIFIFEMYDWLSAAGPVHFGFDAGAGGVVSCYLVAHHPECFGDALKIDPKIAAWLVITFQMRPLW